MADDSSPRREEILVRALPCGLEVRDANGDGGSTTMVGHFAVFNDWTEINSAFEGNFMERIAPGAFRKTFKENRSSLRVLYDHGHDPSLGNKPIGTIDELHEDATGAYYEVGLFDAPYVTDNVLPGLRAGQFGSSFRFRVLREDITEKPERSDQNPDALPERTVKEVRLFEFGPVTFPAYASATAGLRSLTDEWIERRMGRSMISVPNTQILAVTNRTGEVPAAADSGTAEPTPPDAPSSADAANPGTSAPERREKPRPRFKTKMEYVECWKLI